MGATETLVGRDDDVRAVVRHLATHPNAVVTITGLPGVGKSALAAEVMRHVASGTKGLKTAYEPLGVAGEHVVRLAPLAISFAVDLFLRRAREADLTFEPDADDLAAIEELCRLLDGLPLAIERAAAQVGVMRPPAMLDLARQRGAWDLVDLDLSAEMQRAIDALDNGQLRVLLALATFGGEPTVDAIYSVAAGPSVSETIAILGSLMRADLVRSDPSGVRYTVMASAAPLLRPHLEAAFGAELRDRHVRYVSQRARSKRDEVADKADDLQALDWLWQHGTADEVLRLAVDLVHGFVLRGDPHGGRAMLVESLAFAGDSADARTRAEAHLGIVRFAWEGTAALDVAGAARHLREAARLAEESGDRRLAMKVVNAACERHILLGSFREAEAAIQTGFDLCDALGDDRARVNMLGWQAIALHQSHRPAEAEPIIWSAIELALPLGDRVLTDRTCVIYWGLPDSVRQHDADVPSLTELIELARRDGDARGEGWLLTIAIGAAIDREDLSEAADACRSALELSRRAGNAPLSRQVLAGAIRLAAHTGRWETAALLEGVLSRDTSTVTARIPPHSLASLRAATACAREKLGEARRQAVFASGHRMRLPEAITACERFLDELAAALPTPLADGQGQPSEVESILVNTLTPRERDVLAQLSLGHSNKEIAHHLGLREKTVMHHCAAIYRKLGVPGRAAAVAMAVRADPPVPRMV